ncbi:non-specific serine/threonine protein kinase [Malassezia vespertilionis]|uniref:Serine/threonine-protein kinase RIO2 n=1 Tax=Malassezia vespertilionis TaxID=2020962 RepID=A0A2N1JH81_9BASI|nr:non-specific serine/threonine protein kinase [Malassezia vespertilionis]PKI85906.1 hypothetical protein MVES_000507 [Malassezia vespertilionis]WFD05222.1 non-specific serine/threonine protein kinase [Malassezia vespertilionis]
MRLDPTDVRYITADSFRVLTAVEMGSKNHEVVPSSLIAQISALRHAGINKLVSDLAKRKLVSRVQNNAYDGVRLTYGGYDYLAVRALSKRKSIYSVGHRIGVGKESDINLVASEDGEQRVLKIHRLGRISFRKVKEKRDYMGKRSSASWMYMSRLAAEREFEFMQALHKFGYPVPTPIDQARHTIVMSFEDAYPLRQIVALPEDQVHKLYSVLMALIVRLAHDGLIHGDFNEFNLLVREIHEEDEDEDEDAQNTEVATEELLQIESKGVVVEKGKGFERLVVAQDSEEEEEEEEDDDEECIEIADGVQVEPILIDFPQMVSIDHANAEYYFTRDVDCIRRFFKTRFRYESSEYPTFAQVMAAMPHHRDRIDRITKASGYGRLVQKDPLDSLFERMRMGDAAIEVAGDSSTDAAEESDAYEDDEESDAHEDKSADVSFSDDPSVDATRKPRKPKLDASEVATRVAHAQTSSARRTQKHHGRKSQATKTGRLHGGGKAKSNKSRVVQDSLVF